METQSAGKVELPDDVEALCGVLAHLSVTLQQSLPLLLALSLPAYETGGWEAGICQQR